MENQSSLSQKTARSSILRQFTTDAGSRQKRKSLPTTLLSICVGRVVGTSSLVFNSKRKTQPLMLLISDIMPVSGTSAGNIIKTWRTRKISSQNFRCFLLFSAVWGAKSLYFWGRNGGQFGYFLLKSLGSHEFARFGRQPEPFIQFCYA